MSARQAICAFMLLAAGSACHRSAPKKAESEPPVPVVTEPVQMGTIRGVVSTTALVQALPGSDFLAIAPEPGRIVELSKKASDQVKAGEVLIRFEFPSRRSEGAVLEASTKSAGVRLQNAKVMQDRVHKLRELGAASQREVDEADAAVVEAEAEVTLGRATQEAADASGQHTTLRAPFNGLVAERLHNPGDMVEASSIDVILRVIDPLQVEVAALVPVAEASRFALGASARGITETNSTPEVLRVTARPAPEPGATTVPVRLAFVGPTELRPGTQLAVDIDAEQRSNVPLVPTVAVVKDGNGPAVFIAAGNQARRRPVVLGLADAERVEIRSGLKAGEMVVTQGQSNLRDGGAITISQ
jgi:RND family efflux transporter MFP subunit